MRHRESLEANIEGKFCVALKAWAYSRQMMLLTPKLTMISMVGWPDRVVLWPNRGILFVEFKRPGEEPRPIQRKVHEWLRSLGFEVKVYDDVSIAVDEVKAHILASLPADAGDEADGEGGRV